MSEPIYEKGYTADMIPEPLEDDEPIEFTVYHEPANDESEQWCVSSDLGCTWHATLDQALFWELVMGGRHISEQMRATVLADFTQLG